MEHLPIVGTQASFYDQAAFFEKTLFGAFSPEDTFFMQAYRVVTGFACVMMFIEYLYVGPTDTLLLSSYLSAWGIVSTFVAQVSQYKAANYEVEKIAAIDAGRSSLKFPYSPWYKRVALTSLEVSFGLNIIVFVAYWTYIFPN